MDECIHGLTPDTCSVCIHGITPWPKASGKRPFFRGAKRPAPRYGMLGVDPRYRSDRPNAAVHEPGGYASRYDDRRFATPGRLEGENRPVRPWGRTAGGQRPVDIPRPSHGKAKRRAR